MVKDVSGATPENRPTASGPGKRAKFPRSVHLLRHSDFERVYKTGRRHFASRMTVFYLPRAEGHGPRIGFTVSKTLGGAVDRNRMKRRLREAVRLHWPEFHVPVDIVINPKKSVLAADFADLGKEISRAFEVVQQFAEKR
ncbi:MAG: ribonuclease P protein component [Acidobacteriia bacterium]|nr:ribonuclease P protein component [Terriglobia bacterium]